MKTHFKNLGFYLKEKRELAGFTQVQLAQRLKVHPQFISNWERGVCRPPSYLFKKLMVASEIPKEEFLEFLCNESAARWKRLLE